MAGSAWRASFADKGTCCPLMGKRLKRLTSLSSLGRQKTWEMRRTTAAESEDDYKILGTVLPHPRRTVGPPPGGASAQTGGVRVDVGGNSARPGRWPRGERHAPACGEASRRRSAAGL